MPRYVVLTHRAPPDADRATHWDIMLELGAALRTWALDHPPVAGETISALALADHRLAYLDYEGPVSENRGDVSRWDQGEYTLLSESPDRVQVRIEGAKIRGIATISRLAASATVSKSAASATSTNLAPGDSGADDQRWSFALTAD